MQWDEADTVGSRSSHENLSTGAAAQLLGVSGATVRNWCKAGYLTPTSMRPLTFAQDDIVNLKERILNNRFNRLRKRANRTASDEQGSINIHDAQISNDLNDFYQLLDAGKNVDANRAVFNAVLHYLQAADEVILHDDDGRIDFDAIRWRRPAVRQVMRDWLLRNSGFLFHAPMNAVRAFLAWEGHDDHLGILYQGLSSVGVKARSGAYFTPGSVIDACLGDLGACPARFLDPCCGTGRYLLRAASHFALDPAKLHGFDSDPVAVDIARINILLHYRDIEFVPDIRCLDSLQDLANGQPECDTNNLLGNVDAIATNPPWGSCKNQKRHKNLTALIKSGESFSLFLQKALTLLKPGGHLSFLLPEAMLCIKAHTDIRRHIITEATIKKISLLGRVFQGVFTPIISLNLVKKPAPDNWQVAVETAGSLHYASQKRFAANVNHAFDVAVTPVDKQLLDRIHAVPHTTLSGQAEWALGIVTGDNKRCVLDQPQAGTEAVLRGRDVYKYAPRPARCFIKYKPESFQQVAPERFYRAPEKLIYRFVSDRLVFAYDNNKILTLNSANILIPRLPAMPIKVVLAFLNSQVFQYVFVKRFRTRKVLKGDLETLPFPLLDAAVCRRLEVQVEKCMGGDYQPAEELDAMIYEIFGLSPDDVAMIEEGIAADTKRSGL